MTSQVGWSDNSNICVQSLVKPQRAAVDVEVTLKFTLFTPTYRLAAQARLNWQVLRVQVSAAV